jgi:hypothetical protein
MKQTAITYEIRIQEQLDRRWAGWFGGLTLSHAENGETVLTGVLPDQAALHGVLASVRDLGLTLISVRRVPPDE